MVKDYSYKNLMNSREYLKLHRMLLNNLLTYCEGAA